MFNMENNEKDRHIAILVLLIPLIINEIISNENISESDAIRSFYSSSLYSALENEATKLWHLSPKCLYVLYRQEQDFGYIDYPEEA